MPLRSHRDARAPGAGIVVRPSAARALGLGLLLLAPLSCSTARGTEAPGTTENPEAAPRDGVVIIPALHPRGVFVPGEEPGEEQGLRFELREGSPFARAAEPLPATVQGVPLPAAEAQRLLARLPALPPGEDRAFSFPPASPPPPRTGATVRDTFPAAEERTPPAPVAGQPAAEPLRVVRVFPEGEVAIAPHVLISFSEPMVPLATLEELRAGEVPARLEPAVAGSWQWLDTRTLRFEPAVRLPAATEYTVVVPAGVRSATGMALGAETRVRFSTPPVRAVGGFPHTGPTALHPVIFLRFDQRVDPAAVLARAELLVNGRRTALRLASAAEVAADSAAASLAEESLPGRWAAFRPASPLPRDARVQLRLLPGTPSLEGPVGTRVTQELPFRTFAPLRVERSDCYRPCAPGAPFHVTFNNPLLPPDDPESWVTVSPRPDNLQVTVHGRGMTIVGDTRSRTEYQVTLAPQVRDVFGQTLGRAVRLSFRTGDPHPMLMLPGTPFMVLDPADPVVRIYTRGLAGVRVRASRVRPEQWPAYGEAVQRAHGGRQFNLVLPGELVVDTVIRPDAGFSVVALPLERALPGGIGHAVVIVEPAGGGEAVRQRIGPQFAWVQGTRVGVGVQSDGEQMLVRATDLLEGTPLGGVQLSLYPSGTSAATAADGTATLTLSRRADGFLLARRGSDVALLPFDTHPWGGRSGWERREFTAEMRWLLTTDRGLYRPGEEVRLRGWVREQPYGPTGDLRAVRGLTGFRFTAHGPRGEELGSGDLATLGAGGFEAAIQLPREMNLGHASFIIHPQGNLSAAGQTAQQHFQVQEFRRPDFEVTARTEAGPYIVGDTVRATVRAAYFATGPLGDAMVSWRAHATDGEFTPPGWDGWRFGRAGWTWFSPRPTPQSVRTLEGRTGADGEHTVAADLLSLEPPFTSVLRLDATVHDVTRQTGTASTQALVHPATLYAGLRTERGWIRPGDTLRVQVAAVDLSGGTVPGTRVRLTATTQGWHPFPMPRRGGGFGAAEARVDTVATCEVISRGEPAVCPLVFSEGGTFRVTAELHDAAGRPNRTEMIVWVAGGRPLPGIPGREAEQEVALVPDRESYQPGDTARVLVQAPFAPATGTVTLRRDGILRADTLHLGTTSRELRIPITEGHLAGVHVGVELVQVGRGEQTARGEVMLQVPPLRRELQVRVRPADTLATPGAEVWVEVEVRGAAGRPAPGAEVTLWAVDEAILALGGYRLPDPLEAFYPPRRAGVGERSLQPSVIAGWRSAGPGTLSGIVMHAEGGHPVPGAAVRLEGRPETVTTTRQTGEFVLSGVPAGEHVVIIEGAGGERGRRRVMVEARGTHAGVLLVTSAPQAIEVTGARLARGDAAVEMQQAVALEAAPPPPAPPPAPAVAPAPGAPGGVVAPGDVDPVEIRTDFAPLALWEPALRADASGRVRVRMRLPGSLTRYRLFAVATEGEQRFGRGEATVTARRELMVRPTLPRFLNFGDRVELPVSVQNSTGGPLTVDVGVRASGLTLEGSGARRVTVPAGGRVEVRFPASATRTGTAVVQAIVASGGRTDAASVELPVYTPATAEAFAVYGSITTDRAERLPVMVPRNVLAGFGGLEVTVSSTQLQELTDALLFLESYPFEGAEPLASRILAVAALRDVLTAFQAAELPSPEEIDAAVRRDIQRLAALQRGDGGWSYWPRAERADAYLTVHVMHALQRAAAAGYAVPAHTFQRGTGFLHEVERRLPPRTTPRVREAVVSYALYVRHLMGDGGAAAQAAARARMPAAERPLEASGWLLAVLGSGGARGPEAVELLREIQNRATETAATATFVTRYQEEEEFLLLHSDRRTDAVILEALLLADPQNPLVEKTARGLLAHRVRGAWRTTQENAWVMLSLGRFFRVYEAETPNFTSRVWFDGRYAGGHPFRGRTTERHHLEVPMAEVLRRDGQTDLLLQREGTGRLYYRAGLRYAPADLRLPTENRGFAVERVYEAIDDPGDVRREADGSWRIRAGARVRVRVSLLAPARRYHVALVDPLPAGLEPLNPALAGQEPPPDEDVPGPPRPLPGRGDVAVAPRTSFPGWGFSWFQHQNLRDDRAEAFSSLLPAGRYEYVYTARATTPGVFVVPPPRAEEMYHPETFGRGESVRVTVH